MKRILLCTMDRHFSKFIFLMYSRNFQQLVLQFDPNNMLKFVMFDSGLQALQAFLVRQSPDPYISAV